MQSNSIWREIYHFWRPDTHLRIDDLFSNQAPAFLKSATFLLTCFFLMLTTCTVYPLSFSSSSTAYWPFILVASPPSTTSASKALKAKTACATRGTTAQLPSATALSGRHGFPRKVEPRDTTQSTWYKKFGSFIADPARSRERPKQTQAQPNHSNARVSKPGAGLWPSRSASGVKIMLKPAKNSKAAARYCTWLNTIFFRGSFPM